MIACQSYCVSIRVLAARPAASPPAIAGWLPQGPIDLDRAGFAALPDEIALRLIGRAITLVGDEGPVELRKLEALAGDLKAVLMGAPEVADSRASSFRRTLAGALVGLGKYLRVERAPPRRRRKN